MKIVIVRFSLFTMSATYPLISKLLGYLSNSSDLTELSSTLREAAGRPCFARIV